MKKTTTGLLLACCLLLACSSPTPEKYFSIASLNCNLLYGFAGPGMQSQLARPSEKLVDEKTYATAPMTRKEVLETKLEILQDNYEKVKALPAKEDAREMVAASLALYEYTLPVYKTEYKELAALYDGGAPAERIAELEKYISETYGSGFEVLYNKTIATGTAYAAKHGIQVRTVNPAPY